MLTYDVEVKTKSKWHGKITLKIPAHNARLMALGATKAHHLKGVDPSKKGDKDAIAANFYEVQLPVFSALWESYVKPLIQAVDITGPEGEKITTVEELEVNEEVSEAWLIAVGQYVEGFGPGKKRSKS